MKKLFITTLIAASLISSAFAFPLKEVSIEVTRAFEAEFPAVTNVKWVVTKEYTKATFVKNDVSTEAFFNSNSEFIGTTHAVSLDDLPIFAKRRVAKKYGSYTVKEAIEFNGEEETAYFISVENEKEAIILKVAKGTISIFKTSGKGK